MKPANKYVVQCATCGEPLTVIVNKSLKNHEKPVAFCTISCFLKYRQNPRRK